LATAASRRNLVPAPPAAAGGAGTRFLREAAVAKLLAGVTTLEEINRVTFVEPASQL
jgi:type IV pilus assembly protein PilB